jgi:hypothetical protein
MDHVKIGDKGKHLKIRDGYYVVTTGNVQEEDLFANVGNPNSPHWSPAEKEDIGDPVDWFECIIRKINQ